MFAALAAGCFDPRGCGCVLAPIPWMSYSLPVNLSEKKDDLKVSGIRLSIHKRESTNKHEAGEASLPVSFQEQSKVTTTKP